MSAHKPNSDRLVRPMPSNHEEVINLNPLSDAKACYRRYKDQLTPEEQAWMKNFLAANYRNDDQALKALGLDLRGKTARSITADRLHRSHAGRRAAPSDKSRTSGYSPRDYIAAETSPEDAIVNAFDDERKTRTR